MISTHTSQSIPAADLMQWGVLTLIGNDLYRHESPGNLATGVGPVGSTWRIEPGEQAELNVVD